MARKAKEQRQDPRVAADLRLHLPDGDELVEMQVSNVSLGGVYCRSTRFFEPMTRMEVVLEVPTASGTAPVRTEAVVVRAERGPSDAPGPAYRLALWFHRMTGEHRNRLMRFLGTYEH